MQLARLVLSGLAGLVLGTACAQNAVPDPKLAAQEYARAIEAGNADKLYELLDAEGQRALSRAEVKRLLLASKAEMLARARRLSAPQSQVSAEGVVRFRDGEQAVLALEDGVFRVQSAGVLPVGANTPEQAISELRRALARRSYAAVSRVLTKQSRIDLEVLLRSLSEGLREPSALQIEADGDRATVTAPGGHRIELRREDGQWKVQDFE